MKSIFKNKGGGMVRADYFTTVNRKDLSGYSLDQLSDISHKDVITGIAAEKKDQY